jgi:methanogenic corrinoid protein MtbC1
MRKQQRWSAGVDRPQSPRPERSETVHVSPAPATYVGTILDAVHSFSQARVLEALDEADAAHGLGTTINEVVFPSLRVAGTFWSSGTIDVAHEHLLSLAVARWVAARSAALPQPTRHGTILLSAGPADMHTLALDCLDLLLTARGVEVCNLGAQTPTSSLLVVVRSVYPTAVVLSSHTPTVASHAVRSVKAVAEVGLPVYVAGSSFASQFLRQNLPGVPLDGTLQESAELLVLRHTSPSAEPGSLAHEHFRTSVAASA